MKIAVWAFLVACVLRVRNPRERFPNPILGEKNPRLRFPRVRPPSPSHLICFSIDFVDRLEMDITRTSATNLNNLKKKPSAVKQYQSPWHPQRLSINMLLQMVRLNVGFRSIAVPKIPTQYIIITYKYLVLMIPVLASNTFPTTFSKPGEIFHNFMYYIVE